ncbi:hypothetical protein AQUCO_00300183v1 [Aquilegia coerulea]|uniref:KIB1-4 beta-propeller domain-containing protein n=1 Tax=Aquilegia coerulea TaxID=218851 RepID=A0A2G5EXM0_AQUCA|nr:hypothetical protein AQUCO_00300183v1 [Aquilegia coerulea]
MAAKRRENERCNLWSKLPIDLLENNMRCLYRRDHLSIRAVCTEWQVSRRFNVLPLIQLPWFMVFDQNDSWSSCKLHDPLYHRTCTINISDGNKGLLQGKNYNDVKIHACRNGWFLMSQTSLMGSLFCYTPFINGSVVELPELKFDFQIATFSTTPNDPSCVFFALYSQFDQEGGIVRVSTCGLKDKEWNTYTYTSELDLSPEHPFTKVVFLEGDFYCSTNFGTLASFDIARQGHMTVFRKPKRETNNSSEWASGDIYLVELDGTIAFIQILETESVTGDRVLFLGGCDSSFPTTVAGKNPNRVAEWIFGCSGDKARHFNIFHNARSYACSAFYGPLANNNCRKLWI